MTKISAVLIFTLLLILTGCTENDRAKSFGGTMTIDVPAGQKLVTATWKESQLWYLTRPSRDGEKPEVSTFRENSRFGAVEGKVIFKEH